MLTEDTPSHLDYDDLVARYNTGLVDNLRSFGFHTDYLDLWVPDEDVNRSLLNLMEAAVSVGQTTLTLRLGAATMAALDYSAFEANVAGRGTPSLSRHADGSALLILADLRTSAAKAVSAHRAEARQRLEHDGADQQARPLRQPERFSTFYAGSVMTAAGPVTADPGAAGPVAAGPVAGAVECRGECDGLVLTVWIDPASHLIRAAAHQGARGDAARALAAVTCRTVIGLPVLEAAGHGMIRVEFALRPEIDRRPVDGVVTPEAADPAFAVGNALLRGVLADYRRQTGFAELYNDFDPGPGPAWMAADEAERRRMIRDALAADGFSVDDIDIVAIEYDVRVVVALDGDSTAEPARSLVALERSVKNRVDGRLELFLTEVKDSNKIRRLSEQGVPQS